MKDVIMRNSETKLLKSFQLEVWVSVKSVCLILRTSEKGNRPVYLGSFEEWNCVINIILKLGVVKCRGIEDLKRESKSMVKSVLNKRVIILILRC